MPLITSDLEFSDDYPAIEPSLKLDFANARALDPRITFTRASSASYVGKDGLIKLALANEPRFDHDPITGESLGLLIEESRTNYQSGNTTNFGIMDIPIIQGVSTASDVSTAPNGIQQAGRITGSGVDEIQRIGYNTQSTPSGQYNIFSVFVKADSGTPILGFYSNTFVASNVAFNVDLSDGTTNTINAPADFVGKVEPFQNGWYRVSVMGTGSGASGSWNINIVSSLTSARGAQSGSNNASASYFIWGVQEELASSPFASSVMFIQKAGSFTREQDEGNITGSAFSSFFNTTEGVLQTEFSRLFSLNNQMVVQFKDNNASERIEIRGQGSSGNSFRMEVIEGGATAAQEYTFHSNSPVANVVGQFAKVNLAYKQNDFASTINGTIASTDNSGDVGVCDRVGIGYANYGVRYNGHIKNIIYYPKRLTNTQLQTLTK